MERLISLLGMVTLLGLGFLLSKHKRHINFRTVWAHSPFRCCLALSCCAGPWDAAPCKGCRRACRV